MDSKKEAMEIVREVSNWHIQPYAGARYECIFCGRLEGHADDCISKRALALLAAEPEPCEDARAEAVKEERELNLEAHSLLSILPECREATWEKDRINLVKRLEASILSDDQEATKEPCPECGAPYPYAHKADCQIGEVYRG